MVENFLTIWNRANNEWKLSSDLKEPGFVQRIRGVQLETWFYCKWLIRNHWLNSGLKPWTTEIKWEGKRIFERNCSEVATRKGKIARLNEGQNKRQRLAII